MGKKIYAVRVGRKPDFYYSWKECQEQIKGFPKAEFKGFDLMSEAQQYMAGVKLSSGKEVEAKMAVDPLEDKALPMIEEEAFTNSQNQALKLPEEVTIYTDGSCFNAKEIRQGRASDGGVIMAPGGYAAVFLDTQGNELLRLTGGAQKTTNNQMELTAVKEALQHLEDGTRHRVHIISDSEYMVNSFTKNWVNTWKNKALKMNDELIWRKKTGEVVKNQDIMKAIDRLCQHHDVQFEHTRAHVGTKYNELCDQLAKKMSEQMNRVRSFEANRKEEANKMEASPAQGVKRPAPGKDMSNGR